MGHDRATSREQWGVVAIRSTREGNDYPFERSKGEFFSWQTIFMSWSHDPCKQATNAFDTRWSHSRFLSLKIVLNGLPPLPCRVVISVITLFKCQAISPNTGSLLFEEITDIPKLIATNQIKYWFFAKSWENQRNLLFFRDINDIFNCSVQLKFYFFVDDSNLLYTDTNLKSLEGAFNTDWNLQVIQLVNR